MELIDGFEVFNEPVIVEISRPGRGPVWPLAKLDVGQTIYVTDKDKFRSAYSAARYLHHKTDKRFRLEKISIGLSVQRIR